jgi:putative ABC transport system substrate-binding protein
VGILITRGARSDDELIALIEQELQARDDGSRPANLRAYRIGLEHEMPAFAAELVQQGVRVIVANGPVATRAAREATASIPIVATGVGSEPLRRGWASSYARPGGNLTGFLTGVGGSQPFDKQLELLKEVVPHVERVAILHDTTTYGRLSSGLSFPGIRLQVVEVSDPADIDDAFVSVVQRGAEALTVTGSPLIARAIRRVAELAIQHRLPTVFGGRESVEAGGLIGYGPLSGPEGLRALIHQVAEYVDKILAGTPPGDLPIQQPSRFELVINLRTAKALGIAIPESMLARADLVIH